MKTLEQQIREAQLAYQRSFAKHPRSAWTTELWHRLRDLMTRELRKESRAA